MNLSRFAGKETARSLDLNHSRLRLRAVSLPANRDKFTPRPRSRSSDRPRLRPRSRATGGQRPDVISRRASTDRLFQPLFTEHLVARVPRLGDAVRVGNDAVAGQEVREGGRVTRVVEAAEEHSRAAELEECAVAIQERWGMAGVRDGHASPGHVEPEVRGGDEGAADVAAQERIELAEQRRRISAAAPARTARS